MHEVHKNSARARLAGDCDAAFNLSGSLNHVQKAWRVGQQRLRVTQSDELPNRSRGEQRYGNPLIRVVSKTIIAGIALAVTEAIIWL